MTSSSAGEPLIYPIHEKRTEGGSPPPLAVGGKGGQLDLLAMSGGALARARHRVRGTSRLLVNVGSDAYGLHPPPTVIIGTNMRSRWKYRGPFIHTDIRLDPEKFPGIARDNLGHPFEGNL